MVQAPHGYNLEQREITYAWLLKWLGDDTADRLEGEFSIESERDTWSTLTGNVYAEGQSRQPQALVLEHLRTHRPTWAPVTSRKELVKHTAQLQDRIRTVLGLPRQASVPEVEVKAERMCGDLELTPILLNPEKGIVLPGLWIKSADPPTSGPVLLYLHDNGKINLAQETIVNRLALTEGFRILAVDLRGMGETAPGEEGKFWDFLAGQPILAQRVADVRSILSWLSQPQVNAHDVHIWAQGVTALGAALAAALDENVTGLVLEEPLLCFESVVTVKVPTFGHRIMAPGVLEHFDLPQVYQALSPRKVTLINPLRGDGVPASQKEADKTYRPVSAAYASRQRQHCWRVLTQVDQAQRSERLLSGFRGTSDADSR
jgi:pimeloyl-ACP methyl ester carboxylesterase